MPEAPLGEPRDDEPRLVAARGFPRERRRDPRLRRRPAAGDRRARHVLRDRRARAPEETEARPPVPLRKAPTAPANGAAAPAPAPRARPAAPAPAHAEDAERGPRTGGAPLGPAHLHADRVLLFAAVLYAFNKTFQPFHGDGSGTVAVDIPQNTDAGRDRRSCSPPRGVVDSARFFELNATISGDRGNLRPGRYTLKQGMTNGAAIDALTKVPEAPQARRDRRRHARRRPVDQGERARSSRSPRRSRAATPRRRTRRPRSSASAISAPRRARRPPRASCSRPPTSSRSARPRSDLVKQQLDAFDDNFKGVSMKYAKRKKLTRYDVLIIASMIEREAQLPRERRLVSAVIYNRLKQGMPLGIDATIRYATNNWQRPIRQSELDKPGPYNSRLNRSLPPTPIGNPGLASIKAAAKPVQQELPVLRPQARQVGRARVLLDRRAVREGRREVPGLTRRTMIRLGVCGWPVAHSRSPRMHNAALAQLGLDDWHYQALPLPPHLFTETVKALPRLASRA